MPFNIILRYKLEGGGRGVGGGLLPYSRLALWICDAPKPVWFLSSFGLKMVIDFYHSGLKTGMIFRGEPRNLINVNVFSTSTPDE